MSIPFVNFFLILLEIINLYCNKSVIFTCKGLRWVYLLYSKLYIYRVLLYKQDLKHDEDMKQGPSYEEFMCRLGPYD